MALRRGFNADVVCARRLGFMFGPIGGLDDAGNLMGVLDIDWHYQTAKANGAAAHIQRKPSASAPAH